MAINQVIEARDQTRRASRDEDVGSNRLMHASHHAMVASGAARVTSAEHTHEPAVSEPALIDAALATGARNICMMHFLERIAANFNEVEIPLIVLKGSALNLTLYDNPDERPMGDLDLLIRPTDIDRACAILEGLRCQRGEPMVREDFFPRFYYELEYIAGEIYPIKIDVHVRPFRPLRYARLVPDDALWGRATSVPIGEAMVLVPCAEDMLIHLGAHAAIHGNSRSMWRRDIRLWVAANETSMDWDRFLSTVDDWRLALPVRKAIENAERDFGEVCPRPVMRRLARMRASWCDRLALWQAPRDETNPVVHVAVNVLCTPGLRFSLAYLLTVLLPDRGHMGEWYCHRHRAWLPFAHLLRWSWPVVKNVPTLWRWFSKIEIRESGVPGIGVFATRNLKEGEIIARYRGKALEQEGRYVGWRESKNGQIQRHEITGRLRYLNHSCRPNAELRRPELVALQPIAAGREIRIDYGEGTCSCERENHQSEKTLLAPTSVLAFPDCGS